ncbi:uncharacterized protein LOC125071783 isoform X3 [Vanessa atalanta]|uniref:uncharacterized protein LOC125071783 isoform X3 n=1 Tax=Vanessa atalanta TaxID=42275 RepID=UPI001FCCD468|nr:uncharacterized protein LOC125071783 isoform X3 [Vanessa atalanta]
MLINTFLDTEDFVHLYYPEDEPPAPQGCGAGARLASKYPRPTTPEYKEVAATSSEMSERERYRAPPQPEPPPHRVRASDLYPRMRTHYDEPGLESGFAPICGEFVQWVGRTADGGTIAMSNYRLHLQPRRRGGPGASVPLRLIDALEIRDLLCLYILCKHGRQLKCSFNTGDQCVEWWRRLNTALVPIGSLQETFAAAYAAWAKELPPTSVHKALMRASQAPQRHWFGPELERLGFTTKGAWRVTAANAEYKLCPSYPPLLIVPACIGDEDLDSVARFRAMRRIPAVVWRHRSTGAVIARSSQPEVGWLGWRSSEDERLLAAFVTACNQDRPTPNKQLKLLIVDARSYASAVTNRARGGGCECAQYYPAADIQFMSLPNIHHVRRSFQQMRALSAEPGEQANWHSNLERTVSPHANGLMTKTRSCDNLLSEGEKRTTQRRCSDPNLAPDVMKLSLVVNGGPTAERSEGEAPVLTDSCVEQLTGDTDTETDQVDGLHPDHFENRLRDITSNSSSLERELVAAPTVTTSEQACDAPADTPEEPPVFVCETYTDVLGMAEAARETARTRNISITWRSISESSNQSSTGFDVPENSPQNHTESKINRLQETPIDNHNSTEGDVVNHNIVNQLTNHNREMGNGDVNGLVDVATKFLEVDLNGGASSSGASSESEGEAEGAGRAGGAGTRVASQLTLCPASPRRAPRPPCAPCPHCAVCLAGEESSGSSDACWCGACDGGAGASRARCVCGAGLRAHCDSLDGLPPAADPLQARLHQIILYQKKVVEELSGQLREAREALRRASPAPPPAPQSATQAQVCRNGNGNGGSTASRGSGGGSSAASGSSSGSASEVEVGEEARGVLWLPDSAAPRCQHCRNQFWLARRRHHCRRCGGIFCGSCSEMSPWGELGAVRVCRRCRLR